MSKTNPLYVKADAFVKEVYAITNGFPKHELYGVTSQLRRASLSVILNLVEGFSRSYTKEYRRFVSISFASLQEALYLLEFAMNLNYMSVTEYTNTKQLADEVSKIIWSIMKNKG